MSNSSQNIRSNFIATRKNAHPKSTFPTSAFLCKVSVLIDFIEYQPKHSGQYLFS